MHLALVVDVDPSAAEAVATRHGARWSTDPDELMGCAAVIVSAPTELHVALSLPLLAARIPLLVEKPLASNPADVDTLIEAARANGTPLMCGFVERFNAAVVTGLSRITGPLISMQAIRHSPAAPRIATSVVSDLLIHDIDLVAGAVGGGMPTSISGALSVSDRSCAEQADVILGWADGPVANLSASRLGQRKVRTLSVASGAELVEIDLLRQNVTVYRHVTHEMTGGSYRSDTIIDIPFVRHAGEPLLQQLDHFLDLVRGDVDPEAELLTLIAPHHIAARVESQLPRVSAPG
jgi:predicted dehydrogenase